MYPRKKRSDEVVPCSDFVFVYVFVCSSICMHTQQCCCIYLVQVYSIIRYCMPAECHEHMFTFAKADDGGGGRGTTITTYIRLFVHGSCNPYSNAFFQHVRIRCEDGTVNNSFFLDQLLLFKFMQSLVLSILCMHGQRICGSRRDDDDRTCPGCFHSVSFHVMEMQAQFHRPARVMIAWPR